MRTKFIKHRNPRRNLGLGPLHRRNFKSIEDFINWLFNYLIPDFYGMENGPELWEKVEKITKEENTLIPEDLFQYIEYNIIRDILINDLSRGKTLNYDYMSDLKDKIHEYNTAIKNLNRSHGPLKEMQRFVKSKNPRKALGLDILSKREFDSYEEFIDWLYKYLVPDFYGMPNGPKLYNKIEKIVDKEKTYVPRDFLYYFNRSFWYEIKINGEFPRTEWIYLLRDKWPF